MKETIKKVIEAFSKDMEKKKKTVLSFSNYLELIKNDPQHVLRNHFQFFYDVIKKNLKPLDEIDENDTENIGFRDYDSSKLLEIGFDNPFFSNTLLNNRLMQIVETLHQSSQQNKIYIIQGSPGCGKSTCINNLLQKCEEEANSEENQRLEVLWKINKELIRPFPEEPTNSLPSPHPPKDAYYLETSPIPYDPILNVPCPSHDPPILILPKEYRKKYLKILLENQPDFLQELLTSKKYDWVMKDKCCTICETIFWNILDIVGLEKTLKMIHAQPYEFNRRLGSGISIFNPDDKEPQGAIITDSDIQEELDKLFKNSTKVKYVYSKYAKTNYGFYALMDIENQNKTRLGELHNVISEGTNKVGYVEENVKSIFIAVKNPEEQIKDEENKPKSKDSISNGTIVTRQSFIDRQEVIMAPYLLDPEKEIKTYHATYGKDIEQHFLPKTLLNFARVIIAARMTKDYESVKDWIKEPREYKKYCDEDLILLRIELYRARIPSWLSDEDRKSLTAEIRRKIIAEAIEREGYEGYTGRDSIELFYKFYGPYAKSDKLINMAMMKKFFEDHPEEIPIPAGFLDSLIKMYDYSVVQEIKESIFHYNEEQISKDILNYLFAVFEDENTEKKCPYTGDNITVTEEFLADTEDRFSKEVLTTEEQRIFRNELRKSFTMILAQKPGGINSDFVKSTELYEELHKQYSYNLKESALDPFLGNKTFRKAILDYGKPIFETHDERMKRDVTHLIEGLQKNFKYSQQGAQEVCIYAIDNKLAETEESEAHSLYG